jgi:hypothetical protein
MHLLKMAKQEGVGLERPSRSLAPRNLHYTTMTQYDKALRQKGGAWIITADHGNAEVMIDPVTKRELRNVNESENFRFFCKVID